MKELLTYIAQNLVDSPDAVVVTERDDGDKTVFSLRVAPDDMGKVIGRHGKIAKEIRALMRSVAQRQNKHISVDILDENE
ncbi:MAG: KH domain-containing protein [Oscillospiraceae bacterium]|nr:KH domain-containing protein [Oscillospiraceae bacterium]